MVITAGSPLIVMVLSDVNIYLYSSVPGLVLDMDLPVDSSMIVMVLSFQFCTWTHIRDGAYCRFYYDCDGTL